jgi:lysophospholipase L1-like esterase
VGRSVAMSWSRFVALGDSLTEGVGDPIGRGRLRGWAGRLADGLLRMDPGITFVNLARRSLRTQDVLSTQLPAAIEIRPDLTSALVGMNDLMQPDFDPLTFEHELDRLVCRLGDSGATVLMASFPDVSKHILAPRRVRVPIYKRLKAASDVTRSVAARRGALFADVWNMPGARGRDILSLDRMHPNARGHLMLARAFAALLSEMGGGGIELPEPPRARVVSVESARHLRWLAINARPQALRAVRRYLSTR